MGMFFGPFGLLVAVFPKIEKSDTIAQGIKEKENEFEREWDILIKYDKEAKEAVQKLERYGSKALDELKRAYKVMQDKSKLSEIANQIISDIEAKESKKKAEQSEQMERYEITFDGKQYIFQSYKYEKLEDAINYAKSVLKK